MDDTHDRVPQVLERLYGAGLDDSEWTGVLRDLKDLLGCACLCIATRDTRTRRIEHRSSRDAPLAPADPAPPACSVEPRDKFADTHSAAGDLTGPGTAEGDGAGAAVHLFDWHRESGRCRYCMGARVEIEGGVDGFVGAHWPEPDAHLEARNSRVLRTLLPHVARALLIEQRLEAARERSAGACLLDRIPQGIVTLSATGEVLQVNRKAADILDARDGLAVRDGRLHAGPGREAGQRQALVDDAIRAAGEGKPSSVSLSRPSGARPYTLIAEPVADDTPPPGPRQAAVLLIVSDPETAPKLSWPALMRLFGLTRSEARLAARLAAGDSVEEAAHDLGITRQTAGLHLHHVFAKTGAHRQSALVKLLLESPAALAKQTSPPPSP